MLRLAVATDAETLERVREPLRERGIEAVHVQTRNRALPLDGEAFDEFDGFDVGFVFPPRLMEGGVADASLGVPWVNDREAVLRSRNKAGALARLGRAGVPTPETTMVSNPVGEATLREVWDRSESPVVVKPNSTTRGVGVAKAHDYDSFLGIVDYLDLVHDYRATGDRSFLVQEFLPDARDYRVMCIEGEYVGAVERRLPDDRLDGGERPGGSRASADEQRVTEGSAGRTSGDAASGRTESAGGQWKHNVHRGAEATGVDLDPGDPIRELAEDAATALGIDWLGVDVLVSGERAVVNETNARPTVDAATKYDPDFYDRLAALIRSRA